MIDVRTVSRYPSRTAHGRPLALQIQHAGMRFELRRTGEAEGRETLAIARLAVGDHCPAARVRKAICDSTTATTGEQGPD